MPTECSRDLFGYEVVEGREVVAAFDGGQVTSDAGALLLGAANRALGLVRRLARCFTDGRAPELVEHTVETMLMQRICGIALGYEDLVDHDELRHDPVLATLVGKLEARRKDCAPLAGKSTLNRLEHAPAAALDRYHKIGHDGAAIEGLFVALFLEAHAKQPEQIILDLDATDDPLHGHQEGRFFHGYYDCYCYLPLYVFCGRHLLAAKLRRSNIDASAGAIEEVARIVDQIRARWPRVEVLLRADSGFARDELMAWCEANGVNYAFGLARNERLVGAIADDLAAAELESLAKGGPVRRFADFAWRTRDSWSRARRVVAKAEHLPQGPNPRTGGMQPARVDDNYFGPLMESNKPGVRYTGGYTQDPADGGSYVLNWTKLEPDQPLGETLVLPQFLPADAALLERTGDPRLDPTVSDEGTWYFQREEVVSYEPALDDYPIGTVLPGVVIDGSFDGDRGDLLAGAAWRDGYWTLEVRRALDTGSKFDVPLSKDAPTYLWLAAFNHSQTRHSQHLHPVRLVLQ